MSMTISRKSAGVNKLKDLLNKPLMPKEFHVPASRDYGNAFFIITMAVLSTICRDD